ncbi:hypothetical protein Taro_001221 [Colocasia esculenta]|uniref:Uncharacterized protein n=1 Tax=Colocasia esculenta TaxID=4460 RepID=A0A843T9A9_COLES|nr:hypothetical protein [Colocasia esculenta]
MEDPPIQEEQTAAVHMDAPMEDAPADGEILGEKELKADVNSLFMSQASTAKELSQVKNAIRWFNKEMGSMKALLSDILKEVRSSSSSASPPLAAQPSEGTEEEVPRPSGSLPTKESGPSTVQEAPQPTGPLAEGPTWPVEDFPGPTGPVEVLSGPTGPVEPESEQVQAEEEALAPEPPAPSPIQTPAPPSPPSSSTAPPTPQPFKKPLPRVISSPAPFPSPSTASPVSSTHIPPPPPLFEDPPVSSSAGASSSSGPSSSRPTAIPSSTSHSLLHPSAPPSFITIILEDAQIEGPYLRGLKDEFEVAILQSVLKLGQFIEAIRALGPGGAHTEAVQVDFATLQLPDSASLPPLHSLIMDSSVGSIIFECFARVLGRIKVQKGYLVAFNRFLFREYHQGHVTADVLASALSECERLSPTDWTKLYPLSAHQFSHVNESLAKEGQSQILAAKFLDMNSIHLVHDPYQTWVERYKVYVAMRMELKHKQNFYPVSMDQFLACASFGKVSFLKISLDSDQYARLLDEQLVHHLRRMPPLMGPSYSIEPGGVVPFGCEGRHGVVSRVLFPSVVKEDLVRYPGCCSLRLKEDQLGCWVM